jgi:hypothetical protein
MKVQTVLSSEFWEGQSLDSFNPCWSTGVGSANFFVDFQETPSYKMHKLFSAAKAKLIDFAWSNDSKLVFFDSVKSIYIIFMYPRQLAGMAMGLSMSMLHVHVHAACPSPRCLSVSVLRVRFYAAWPCPCWTPMSMLYVHVHAACPCLCC